MPVGGHGQIKRGSRVRNLQPLRDTSQHAGIRLQDVCRLVFNDTQSSEILAGMIVDQKSSEKFYSLEATTRLSDNWKLNVEGRVFSSISPASAFYGLRNDDFVQIELLYYF